MNPGHPRPAAVVFDMDGLLLDSERLARQTFVHACREAGWEPDLAVYDRCVGSTYEATEQILTGGMGPDFPFAEINRRWASLYEAEVLGKPVPLKPGALELLERLAQHGVPRALATSTRREVANAKLANARVARFFDHLVCGGETPRGKPHPDPYLEAAARLGQPPSRCWALEDSDNGVRAAAAAGCIVYQIPDLVTPAAEVRALAHRVLGSLSELLTVLESR